MLKNISLLLFLASFYGPRVSGDVKQLCNTLQNSKVINGICVYEVKYSQADCNRNNFTFQSGKCYGTATTHSSLNVSAFTSNTNILSRPMNLRSSPQFHGQGNIVSQVPAGTAFNVLSRKKLPSGAEALQIEILSPASKTKLNAENPLYLWHTDNTTLPKRSDTEASTTCSGDACKSITNDTFGNVRNLLQSAEEVNAFVDTTKEITTVAPAPVEAEEETETSTTTSDTSEPNSKKFSQMTKAEKTEALKRYSESANVQNVTDFSIKHYSGKKSVRKCYLGVKNALSLENRNLKSRRLLSKENKPALTSGWYSSRSAYMAATDLVKPPHNFINLLKDPDYKDTMKNKRNWPKGAVLVYRGGRTKHGHVEIKLDDNPTGGSFGSDFVTKTPSIDKRGYTLIGVMVRPDL